jgi:DNA-binding transcriptional LysR family regulator
MQNRKTIDAVFAKLGAVIAPTLETNSILSILAHVGTGRWNSVVPRSVLEQVGIPSGVMAIELVEPSVDWATGLVTLAREPRPPIIVALIEEGRALVESFGKSE